MALRGARVRNHHGLCGPDGIVATRTKGVVRGGTNVAQRVVGLRSGRPHHPGKLPARGQAARIGGGPAAASITPLASSAPQPTKRHRPGTVRNRLWNPELAASGDASTGLRGLGPAWRRDAHARAHVLVEVLETGAAPMAAMARRASPSSAPCADLSDCQEGGTADGALMAGVPPRGGQGGGRGARPDRPSPPARACGDRGDRFARALGD